ncbi:MAG: DUF5906 domain-containing protein [Prevotella sp.]|nr:DUF5906 domain-containing protein [Prevotella sp.]
MKITIINSESKEKRYTREELEVFVAQLQDGTFRQQYVRDYHKEVCFAAEWIKQNGVQKTKSVNRLVLLSLENLRDLPTVEEYKRLATQQPYTLLCFLGHDGHSLHIVCRYEAVASTVKADDYSQFLILNSQLLTNAFRKYHYIYSSQLGTPIAEQEPTFESTCMVSYDPQPFFRPDALAITVSPEPEETPEFRSMQEDISDYNYPEEIPGLTVRESRMRRFHDCLDAAIEAHRNIQKDELYTTAVLEQLADGCRVMGLPQAWCARVASFIPLLGGVANRDTIDSVFKTAYLKETLKTIPMKYTRPSALLTYKTEAYMKEHYTLRLNVMTGVPEYRMNAVGYGFQPLDQAARNTMAIRALKAGVDSWDKDLSRYIDSNLILRYYPMKDYLHHLRPWDGKHDYVGELARRVKTTNPYWEEDFHKWMLSMVAQWTGKDRQYGNAIVPLLIGPQGSGKTTFCHRLLPTYLQLYYNDRLSMKNDNDIFLAMSSYALINIDEFDAMSKSQQPILKYLISKHDVKFRPPYGKTMEERQRFASFIATTNNLRPLTDHTGSRRFICVYADEINNSGVINHEQLYAQLFTELQQKRRYWFEDEENARIIEQNKDFLQVFDYEQMVEMTYLSPEETPANTRPVLVKDIMKRLERKFPTFTIRRGTDMELGRRLSAMGYKYHKLTQGAAYRVVEKAPAAPKQIVLLQ